MDAKWIGFLVFIWIVLLLLAATFDGQSSDANTWGPEHDTTLSYLSQFKKIVYSEEETGAFAWVTPNLEYFDALYALITWDFGFLKCAGEEQNCGYAYFRYIILTPITLAALFYIAYMFIQLLQGFIPKSA